MCLVSKSSADVTHVPLPLYLKANKLISALTVSVGWDLCGMHSASTWSPGCPPAAQARGNPTGSPQPQKRNCTQVPSPPSSQVRAKLLRSFPLPATMRFFETKIHSYGKNVWPQRQ